MSNPNNCKICRHHNHDGPGHCHMFQDEPNDVCVQHTHRKDHDRAVRLALNTVLGIVCLAPEPRRQLKVTKNTSAEESGDDSER